MLESEGHQIAHIDTHSSTEQGKDIISIDGKGRVHGWQLKAGVLNRAEFKSHVIGELQELVYISCNTPSAPQVHCIPHLVVTGGLSNTCAQAFAQYNRGLESKYGTSVQLHVTSELVQRFVSSLGRVIPVQPVDFRDFVIQYAQDGREPVDFASFSKILNDIESASTRKGVGEQRRVLFGSAILVGLILGEKFTTKNHLAIIKAYSAFLLWVLERVERLKIARKHWGGLVRMIRTEILYNLKCLVLEADSRESWFEGDILADVHFFFRARCNELMGWASLLAIVGESNGIEIDAIEAARRVSDRSSKHAFLWGEGAVPSEFLRYLQQRECGSTQISAENRLAAVLQAIIRCQSNGETALPDPYVDISSAVLHVSGSRSALKYSQRFDGRSYTVDPLVRALARALRKQLISWVWYDVADTYQARMEYEQKTDYYKYNTKRGKVINEYYPRPATWNWLLASSREIKDCSPDFLPHELKSDVLVLMVLMLVHPHRFDRTTSARVEALVDSE